MLHDSFYFSLPGKSARLHLSSVSRGKLMHVRQEKQLNAVASEVLALTAVVRPILKGVLYAIKDDVVNKANGRDNLDLEMLARLYRAGDGDCGICFEYAVHEAIKEQDPRVMDRVSDAMKKCRISGDETQSILFGLEKNGALSLINTANELLTDESRLLSGSVGQPPKLRKHLNKIVGAFKNRRTGPALPYSIRGIWKADLVVGNPSNEQWVGTTVKINPAQLEAAAGLRIGIVPTKQGKTDKVRFDENKNLVICPLQYDEDFMQTFYEGWIIVQAFIAADAKIPKEVALPSPAHRMVAKMLYDRRTFPVVDVIDALRPYAQPELLETDDKNVDLQTLKGETSTNTLLAPLSQPTN